MRIKITAKVLDEAHERQVEEVMDSLSERPEGFYKTSVLLKNGRSPRSLLSVEHFSAYISGCADRGFSGY